jgi:cell fate (sporulation/competence/biofilm development) regulator YlbF (YheA/YmcA/DUF963 family)
VGAVDKGQEVMKPTKDTLPLLMQLVVEDLASSLLHAEPIAVYHQAKACLESDKEASAILEQLGTAQAEFRSKQADGHFTQADIDHLRGLNRLAQANQVIVDYMTTQQMATAYLADVNQEISHLLGIDFTTFASSGCC